MLRHVGALCRAIRNKSPMHRKMGPIGYYKGVGARVLGKHVNAGGFQVDALKVPVYDVPDLTGFAVRRRERERESNVRLVCVSCAVRSGGGADANVRVSLCLCVCASDQLRPYVSKNSPSIRVAPPPRPATQASS
jgi:hypothetical protein